MTYVPNGLLRHRAGEFIANSAFWLPAGGPRRFAAAGETPMCIRSSNDIACPLSRRYMVAAAFWGVAKW
jgi:hypothetical protein